MALAMERQESPQRGWYPNPEDPSTEWYWDGERWSESRPRSRPPVGTGEPTGWVVIGYICAFLFPLIGLIIALVPLRNRWSPHWKRVLGIWSWESRSR